MLQTLQHKMSGDDGLLRKVVQRFEADLNGFATAPYEMYMAHGHQTSWHNDAIMVCTTTLEAAEVTWATALQLAPPPPAPGFATDRLSPTQTHRWQQARLKGVGANGSTIGTIILRVVQACARTLRWVIRDVTRIVRNMPLVLDQPWFALLLVRLSDVEFAKS